MSYFLMKLVQFLKSDKTFVKTVIWSWESYTSGHFDKIYETCQRITPQISYEKTTQVISSIYFSVESYIKGTFASTRHSNKHPQKKSIWWEIRKVIPLLFSVLSLSGHKQRVSAPDHGFCRPLLRLKQCGNELLVFSLQGKWLISYNKVKSGHNSKLQVYSELWRLQMKTSHKPLTLSTNIGFIWLPWW